MQLDGVTTGSLAPASLASGYAPEVAIASAFPDLPKANVNQSDGTAKKFEFFNQKPLAANAAFEPVLRPLEQNITTIQAQQFDLVGGLMQQVHVKHAKYARALENFGVSVPRLAAPEEAMGGPFIPIADPAAFNTYLELLHESFDVLKSTQTKLAAVPLRNPLPGHKITSKFGSRIDPFRKRVAMHAGMDFKARTGTPVRSSGIGKVVFAGRKGGYGRMVEIRHPSGHTTRYAHLSRISVKVGQGVDTTTVIGKVGSTGRSTGPHLHYEVRTSSKALDPMRFIAAGRKLGL
jgi:murein DD-endopeptidase MepM/ murein hydrolase activator NlpD